jgi:photosystem II stability/assembly factor-like uncharacterized protein
VSALRRAIAVLVVALAGAPAAHAAIPAPPSQWYGLPGLNAASGAQWVRALAFSTPPSVVVAGLEGGGVFRSVNGGATWSAFNDGLPNPLITNVRALLTSSTGTTIIAGTDLGLFRSSGGGAWQPLAQGPEPDPAKPTKLNGSVQALLSVTGGSTVLAGVFSGGVFRSTDGGETWSPPPANSGMPAAETVYGLTENVPGLVYATAGSGVYVSTDQGTTWKRVSDGIPGSASPITTWAYPERPQVLFTSTGSNGVYRSLNAGVTWAAVNDGLGAVRARGFQILTASQGAHLYAATEEGLWHALTSNSPVPPPPRWRAVTAQGLGTNLIMWSLTTPTIPGSGAPGLIAGTQSNGGYFLSFEPPDSACPTAHTTNTTSACPRVSDTTPTEGQTLSALNGQWTGTQLLSFSYRWQRCTSTSEASCSTIAGAQEPTFVVRPADVGDRLRVEVTAENPAPTFGLVRRFSAITSAAVANPGDLPGANQTSAPSISVQAPGETTAPKVGDTMFAEYGIQPSAFSDGWFNPKATSYAFRWLRCDGAGADCTEIPGATARSYKLTPEDGTRDLRVRVRGTNNAGSRELVSGASYDVTSSPAALASPDQAPRLFGEAFVGETLAGDVGGWQDPTTTFLRRWLRCAADGTACSPIQRAGTTDPETGSTYAVRAEDAGSTIRLRVTADVNGDLEVDGLDNHLPRAVEVDTAPSAVVAFRPGPGVPGPPAAPAPGPVPGLPATDRAAPVIRGARLVRRAIALRLSEAGTVQIVISKAARGRKVGRRCVGQTRRNRGRRPCTLQRTVRTLRRNAGAGDVRVPWGRLRRGTYRATITATDAAGNVSRPVALVLRVR